MGISRKFRLSILKYQSFYSKIHKKINKYGGIIVESVMKLQSEIFNKNYKR